METVKSNLDKRQHPHYDYDQMVASILADPEVAAFIEAEDLSEEEVRRSISKFNQFISERQRFLLGDPNYIAQGYKPILIMNEGYADVSYLETEELIAQEKAQAIVNRIQLLHLPASFKQVRLTPEFLDTSDARRFVAIEKLLAFSRSYPQRKKGYYLYGNFGVGKTYMLAALAHELSEKHGLATTLLHFPDFVLDVKNAISEGRVKEKVDAVKKAPVLVLDDIGAEQMSSWVRDEILQVILQYRMQEVLPTFFTSNLNFEDLEAHFASGRNGDETWQAKRLMERVRFLADELHVEGKNRR